MQQFISGPLCHPTFVGFRYIFYPSHSSGANAPAQLTTIYRPLTWASVFGFAYAVTG